MDGLREGKDRSVGAQLAQARRDAGLTQRELAELIGVRLWTVDQWESDAQPIPAEKLDAIAATIGRSIVTRSGRRPVPAADPAAAAAAGPTPVTETPPEETAAAPAEGPPPPAAQDTSEAPAKGSAPPVSADEPASLTPEAIRSAQLPRSLRGYEETATRRLLDNAASTLEQVLADWMELRQLAAERDDLQRRVTELEKELSSRENAEQTLSRALLAATRASDELIKTAEGEAEEIVATARRAAEASEREIEESRKAIERESEHMRLELRHEVLAATRADLVRLGDQAQPLLDLVQELTVGLRSLVDDGAERGAMFEDLRPPTGEQQREPSPSDTHAV